MIKIEDVVLTAKLLEYDVRKVLNNYKITKGDNFFHLVDQEDSIFVSVYVKDTIGTYWLKETFHDIKHESESRILKLL